jgi:hypothetical protein
MKRLILAAAAAVLTLSGCSQPKAQVDSNLTAAGEIVLRAAIRHGVQDYIGKHGASQVADRAARVKALLDDVVLALDGDPEVTLGKLKDLAYSKIPAELSPMDQMDARDVIDLVSVAIGGYIGQGTLNPEAIVKLRDALQWISQAAGLFAPPV